MRKSTLLLLSLISCSILGAASSAPVPQYDGLQREGVASCASSTCHGSVFPKSTTKVAQNEYVTWSRHDAHANAYKTLLTQESQRIAQKLGLPNAHEADICLDCHADNVSPELHGERFVLSDGIGCEACHGGAQNYIDSHTISTVTHAMNIENGLYPTDDPEARAKLCLSCHFGNEKKMATHEIMGAGHPRLSFELDTFTILQPLHYVPDRDYKDHKVYATSLETWLTGQIQATLANIELIETRLYIDGQLFPEIGLFDCHSCHHPMSDIKWDKQKGNGTKPGTVRLADGHFRMTLAIAKSLQPDVAAEIDAANKQLMSSIHAKGPLQSAVLNLKNQIMSLQSKITNNVRDESALSILKQISSMSSQGKLQDYIAAEQAVMAVDICLSTLNLKQKHQSALNDIYASVASEEKFVPSQLNKQIQKLAQSL